MIDRFVRGVAAAAALLAVVVGTPIALLVLVGNPWPGRTRLRLGDELAIVVGVLAVLAWLVWIRFVVAIVAEMAAQLDERRSIGTAPVDGSGRVRCRTPAGTGRPGAAGPAPRGGGARAPARDDARGAVEHRDRGGRDGAPGRRHRATRRVS